MLVEIRNVYNILIGILQRRDRLGEQGIDGSYRNRILMHELVLTGSGLGPTVAFVNTALCLREFIDQLRDLILLRLKMHHAKSEYIDCNKF
jgi:hypothetical protein